MSSVDYLLCGLHINLGGLDTRTRARAHAHLYFPRLLDISISRVWLQPTGLFSSSVWNPYLSSLEGRTSLKKGGWNIEWSLFMETQLVPGESALCCFSGLQYTHARTHARTYVRTYLETQRCKRGNEDSWGLFQFPPTEPYSDHMLPWLVNILL